MIQTKEISQSLVFFDFDGTLTHKDTLFEIIRFDKGLISFLWGIFLLIPQFLLFFLRKIDSQELKENYLEHFLKNRSLDLWNDTCEKFCEKRLPHLIRKEAFKALKKHQSENSRIVVVSASPENWILPWCKIMKIEGIGSRLETSSGKLTGKLIGQNCNGQEKVKRIKEYLELETYSPIYAYGDTKGDLPMLALADYPFYKVFEN
jgi:HAD superfamily hydrolase (TIGR01490 family)